MIYLFIFTGTWKDLKIVKTCLGRETKDASFFNCHSSTLIFYCRNNLWIS